MIESNNKGKATVKSSKKPKKKVNTNKNWTAGRPSVIDEKVLAKLEEGFAISLTDEECCLYADIHPATLYRYIEKNPKFSERKEILKRTPNINAKKVWAWEIKTWSYQASKEFLERRAKDEFSLKVETENKNTNVNVEIDENTDADELLKIINWN